MRFLILGCNGMAGHVVSIYMRERGHDVTGLARRRSPFVETIVGDARDQGLLRGVINGGRYDSVINCIGILNQDAERNKADAVMMNSFLPHFLEEVTRGTATQVIHMSTDCVFSGDKGSYAEDGLRDGRTFYDRSKALGELENDKDVTLRNSVVGPDVDRGGIGLLNWFMMQEGEVRGYRGAIWTGVTSLELARIMEEAAARRACGLYNMVPDGSISKYELLCLFNRHIRRVPIGIIPDDGARVDKSLRRTRFEGLPRRVPDYEKMVCELGDWMRGHGELYPHYDL